jgi:branched-chain amino acid transport system substrate-binding protein
MSSHAAAVALLGLLASQGCAARVRVGVVLPESGSAAVYGTTIRSGIRLAFDDAVAEGRAPAGLEVIYRDSGSDPSRAALAAEVLYEDGARLIIGGVTTAEAKAMLTVADRKERVLLSPSASAPGLAGRSSYFFRVYPSDEIEGVKAADLLASTCGVRSVLVVEEDNDYTRGLLPVFVRELLRKGGRISGTVRIGDHAWEKPLRESLNRLRPEGIYICAYGEPTVDVIRALRFAGFAGTICVTSAIAPSALLQRASTVADGVFFPLAGWMDRDNELVRTFVRRYDESYAMSPDTFAAHGYDAALVACLALVQPACRSGGDLRVCLHALATRSGVTGAFDFDDYGNILRAPRVHWVHRGHIESFEPQPAGRPCPAAPA